MNKTNQNADMLNTALCAMLNLDTASEEFLARLRSHLVAWTGAIDEKLKSRPIEFVEESTRKTRRPRMESELEQCKLHGYFPKSSGCSHCHLSQDRVKSAVLLGR